MSRSPSSAPAVTPEERQRVVDELAKLGWPAAEVVHAFAIESGWRPSSLNPSTFAAGLAQLMPSNLAKLGFRPDLPRAARGRAFAALSALEQLPTIRAFFARLPSWRVPGDTYVAMAASGFVGAPDNRIVYPQGSKAWYQNPSWRPADNGSITAGSIRNVLLKRMVRA